jgi:hypothetical protein
MRERVVIQNSSQASEQNDWQEFKPLFGGGKNAWLSDPRESMIELYPGPSGSFLMQCK